MDGRERQRFEGGGRIIYIYIGSGLRSRVASSLCDQQHPLCEKSSLSRDGRAPDPQHKADHAIDIKTKCIYHTLVTPASMVLIEVGRQRSRADPSLAFKPEPKQRGQGRRESGWQQGGWGDKILDDPA